MNQLLRPKFLPLLTAVQCATIVRLVRRLIEILGSEDVVLDRYHSPAVYSKFLSSLLDRHHTPSLRVDVGATSELPIVAHYREDREQSPPLGYSWPDTPCNTTAPDLVEEMAQRIDSTDAFAGSDGHIVRQEIGDLDMDFSLPHFVQSTRNSPESTQIDLSDMTFIIPPEALEALEGYGVGTTPHDYPVI